MTPAEVIGIGTFGVGDADEWLDANVLAPGVDVAVVAAELFVLVLGAVDPGSCCWPDVVGFVVDDDTAEFEDVDTAAAT